MKERPPRSRHREQLPEWFTLGERTTGEVMRRISLSVASREGALQVQFAPMMAHWFLLDALLLANRANREGMHANALALTRQCIEAITIIELGVCKHVDAERLLLDWDRDRLRPGELRAWMEANVWPGYGSGLWREPWGVFMKEFAKAIQPYAHYGAQLAQWQSRLYRMEREESGDATALIQMGPRAYDPQKATRITLFHGLLTFVLGRLWIANSQPDSEFEALIRRFGAALGKSRYLDGHETNWGEQFWAMVWDRDGGTELE